MLIDEICQQRAQMTVADVDLEVVDLEWPNPVEAPFSVQRNQFSFSLSARPTYSQVGYQRDKITKHFTEVGDLIFFPAGVPFWGRSEGGPQRQLLCNFNDQKLRPWRPPGSSWSNTELDAGLDLKSSSMRSALARIAHEVLEPRPDSKQLVEAFLTTLFIDFRRHIEQFDLQEKPHKGGLAAWQLRLINERIAITDAPPPSIEELSHLCGISSRHLMRVFKKSTGTTLHHAIEEARMGHAKDLLAKTDLPIKAIALQLGFAQASSFSATFHRVIGIKPSGFRAQYQRKNING
jgi:AraC family transcriptional regulator